MDEEKREQVKQWLVDILRGLPDGLPPGVEFLDHPSGGFTLTLAPDKSFAFPYRNVEKIANADEDYCEQVYKDLVDLAKA
jgi:hypothetical protein